MQKNLDSIVRVGADLAKSVVQVHGIDGAGQVIVAKRVKAADFIEWCQRLAPGCTVGMEACAGSHRVARELAGMGLVPLLIPPALVVPYRRTGITGKNDATDAEAICEASSRPSMRFVAVKTPHQQAVLSVHRLRSGYIKERTSTINRARGLLFEFGISLPIAASKFRSDLEVLLASKDTRLPVIAHDAMRGTGDHLRELQRQIDWCDAQIAEHALSDVNAQKAMQVCGVGKVSASALAASLGDLRQFRNGRQFGAFLGLVPTQRSTGGKQRLGRITKRGDPYLRGLLVFGANAALIAAPKQTTDLAKWAVQLRERVGWGKATVALANRNARILWATLARP